MQPLPRIDSLDPKTIPAYDNGTWIIEIRGKNFIAGQTQVFFDELIHTEVKVLNSTLGTFVAPKRMPPGFFNLRITNNLMKHPLFMRRERVLEYMILPEVHSLLPGELPTRDYP